MDEFGQHILIFQWWYWVIFIGGLIIWGFSMYELLHRQREIRKLRVLLKKSSGLHFAVLHHLRATCDQLNHIAQDGSAQAQEDLAEIIEKIRLAV